MHVTPTLEAFPPFKGSGYGGFVPSAPYLTEVYTRFMLGYEKELTAQIVKASCKVAGIDHSHKVCYFKMFITIGSEVNCQDEWSASFRRVVINCE